MKKLFIALFIIISFIFPTIAMEREKFPETQIPKKEQNFIRVMSFNVRRKGSEQEEKNLWDNRKDRVLNLIEEINPDVFGLQEPIDAQIDDLNKSLQDYKFVGRGRGAQWMGLSDNEHTPIFYNNHTFELLNSGTFDLYEWSKVGFLRSKLPYFGSSDVGSLPRICTWVKLRNKKNAQIFYVLNTHLDHQNRQARIRGLKTIASFVDKQHQKDGNYYPVLLIGDFNAPLFQIEEYIQKFADTKANAQEKINEKLTTRTGWYFDEEKTIDHILLDELYDNTQVKRHMVVKESRKSLLPSDHRPVFVDIQFNE